MACLSIWREKLFVVCANPIFPTSKKQFSFLRRRAIDHVWGRLDNRSEVLAVNSRLGKTERFCLDDEARRSGGRSPTWSPA